MKYTIYSIDDSRSHYKTDIRKQLTTWQEITIECVDGSNKEQLKSAIMNSKHNVRLNWKAAHDLRFGHIGIWLSFLNALEHAPIVTFDDDAILSPFFSILFAKRLAELPDDADFFSLFIPRDSDHLYDESMSVGSALSRVYANYGGVSFYFTERGKNRIRSLIERDGIMYQYDDSLYMYAKNGELNGYCSKPQVKDLVYITGEETSIVQDTEYFDGR